MNFLSLAISAALTLAAGCAAAVSPAPEVAAKGEPHVAGNAAPAPVIIELFTSEGCSSCPPAETVASALQARARSAKQPVFLVAFHVDYWDKLGWKDPFSTAEATARQRDYAQMLALRSLYTPQMVVQGSAEFVGSDRARAERELAAAQKRKSTATLKVALAGRKAGDPLALSVECAGAPAGAKVIAVLCEDSLVVDVKRGENGGRKLTHDGVVRTFAAAALSADGHATFTLTPPKGVVEKNARVVVYVRGEKSPEVLAAAADELLNKDKPAPAAGPVPTIAPVPTEESAVKRDPKMGV